MSRYETLLSELNRQEQVVTTLHGEEVTLRLLNDGMILHLTTTLFCDSYLPQSVREFVRNNPINAILDTHGVAVSLEIDEERCSVLLHGQGSDDDLDPSTFAYLVDSYLEIADQMRNLLNEEGSRDYVYIYHKR